MNWTNSLDIYCERLGPEFWSEPINAITNLSFIIGAVFAYRLGQKRQVKTLGFYWIVTMLFAIGVGSFLFHTFANVWSMYADIMPINLFQLGFIAVYGGIIGRKVGIPTVYGSLLLLVCFVVLTKGFEQFPEDTLNGSIRYGSAFLSLLFIGMFHAVSFSEEKYTLLLATACFTVSLTMRSLDIALCDSINMGTHFIWHLLNGYLLYLVIRAYTGAVVEEKRVEEKGSSEQKASEQRLLEQKSSE